MAKRRKNLLDNVFDRVDDVSKDVRRAGRRTLGSKKKKKRSTRKLAKRNNEELQALTEQVGILVHHLAQRQGGGNLRESGTATAPIARQS